MLAAFAVLIAVLLVALVATYLTRYRGRPWTAYDARPAWIRAGIYFCFCYLLSYLSGGMQKLIDDPIVTSEQLSDPAWWAYTAVAFAFITVMYGVVWVRYTVLFDRPKHFWISALFGFLWGSSSGQLFLAVWLLSNDLFGSEPAAWVATVIVLGAWQPNFHNIYWDHWIAPEHDTRLTQRIKALGCHIPNLLITLTYLAIFDNAAIFVGLQIMACTFASVGMRFPAPWDPPSERDLAHRSGGRVPRCEGYVSDDFTTDPYTPFHPGWTGPTTTLEKPQVRQDS
jgi:hypothetical protein